MFELGAFDFIISSSALRGILHNETSEAASADKLAFFGKRAAQKIRRELQADDLLAAV